jgi:Spy/CpxP family protein refolding chaperone
MRHALKTLVGVTALAGALAFGMQAHAQTASQPPTAPSQTNMDTKSGPWTQGQNERRELREEREKIRAEHEELQAEHDRLKAHCMDAKGQDRSDCVTQMKALHEKREALHERMKALHEKIEAEHAKGGHGSHPMQASPTSAPPAQQ